MSNSDYTPPKVWVWDKENGGKWAGLNRPIAGATHEEILPVGDEALQLYSLGTPNGIKVTVMLEELLALGKADAAYDVHVINIGKGDQFGSEFTKLNPNSKIPVLLDKSGDEPEAIFESCAILHYLANKFDAYGPRILKTKCSAFLGCSGKKVGLHLWAVALDISTAMRHIQWNTLSTAMRWKLNVS